jgi:hypothetical protein
MSSFYNKAENYLNNDKNFNKLIFFIVVFLCIVKLPNLVSSDIQPWDEGMYATRVLSIHLNGDFFDQSSHSVGLFYSGSHPPLLIWIGYISTLLFGINSFALKIIPFLFSLSCIVIIMLLAKKLFDPVTALFSAMIFSSNIIFNVFSKRFQFDYPYTFFILLSFYAIILFNDNREFKYLIISGISFGCCLMVKILVGFYIPLILFISWYFLRGRINLKFNDILFLSMTGIIMALPWHVYMLSKYGAEFTDYFFKFHIYDRAIHGVEMNEKNSGALYHINYLMTIIPYSVIVFFAMIKDAYNYKSIKPRKLFLWIWFVTGMIILAVFKTKLEVYILLILTPGCILTAEYILNINNENRMLKSLITAALLFNIFWFATESIRPEIKDYFIHANITFELILIIFVTGISLFIIRHFADKIELKQTLYFFILIFFFGINFYYLFRIPFWENYFHITDVKDLIDKSGRKKIVYVATNYRHNPQFSFYFNGLDLGWKNNKYELTMLDIKDGTESVKEKLKLLPPHDYEIIVEKEGINRAVYKESDLFIPEEFKLKKNSPGYELYEN